MNHHLCCPYCTSSLTISAEDCVCSGCRKVFPVLLGIPDLRVSVDAWIDYEEDRVFAASLAAHYHSETFGNLIARVWESRQGIVPQNIIKRRIRQINEAQSKYTNDVAASGWIGSLMADSSWQSCVELGCGTGAFLVAAIQRFEFVVGLDISLTWLVAAKKRLEEQGMACSLVCACVERLPLQSSQFDLTVAFDVLEHVTDARPMLEEIDRVTRAGGKIVCTTPNRYSLSAEPHVGVWGVGFLPRKWMPAYVSMAQWNAIQSHLPNVAVRAATTFRATVRL